MIQLSIIIPVLNKCHYTKSCLLDLLNLPPDHEIIIVDNGSTDETSQLIQTLQQDHKENQPVIKYIRNSENLGFSKANNQGYEIAAGNHVLFLNNDIRIKSDQKTWTQPLIKLCEEGMIVGAGGGLLNRGFDFVCETEQLYEQDKLSYIAGFCIAGSRRTWDRLILEGLKGPWWEKSFAYYEDPDLCWRARQLDIPLCVLSLPLHHFGRVTGRSLNLSKMYKEAKEIFIREWQGKI